MKTDAYKDRFKDHIATPLDNGWVKFAKPGTNIDMLCFQFFYGYWVVVGDLGDAIYKWSEKVTPEWVSQCDLSYVLSKCQASEVGRTFKEWDTETCREDLEQWAKETFDDQDKPRPEFLSSAFRYIQDGRIGWESFLYENGYDLFGDDWYEFAPGFGWRDHIRGILHLAALQVMVEKNHA